MSSSLGDLKIGFIGAGNMAQAIGFQFIKSGEIKAENIIVSAPSNRFESIWKEKGVVFTNNNSDVYDCNVVFIAVKPQFLNSVLPFLPWGGDKLYISLAVGVTIADLIHILGKGSVYQIGLPRPQLVRVMPNTPCMVGVGCSVMCKTDMTSEKTVDLVLRLMRLTGTCVMVEEKLFNALSALGGSGPAYMYMIIEAMSDGAVKLGVPRATATQIAAQMMKGAAEMVLTTGKHPGQLKDEVCSPGGTTICAVHELEKAGVRAAFMNALEAAVTRTEEIAKNTGKTS